FPENFWNPEFQQHPNTANAIEAAVLVAEKPSDHRAFLSAFAGVRTATATSSSISASTPRGDIRVMNRAAFRNRFGTEPPDTSHGRLAAPIQLRGREGTAWGAALKGGGIAAPWGGSGPMAGPAIARGAPLVFAS